MFSQTRLVRVAGDGYGPLSMVVVGKHFAFLLIVV